MEGGEKELIGERKSDPRGAVCRYVGHQRGVLLL